MVSGELQITAYLIDQAREKFKTTNERRAKLGEWYGRKGSLEISRTIGPLQTVSRAVSANKRMPEEKDLFTQWFLEVEGLGVIELASRRPIEERDGFYLILDTIHVDNQQIMSLGLNPMPCHLFGDGNFISYLNVAVCINKITKHGTLYIVDIGLQSCG